MENQENVVIEQKTAQNENDVKAQDALIKESIKVVRDLRVRANGLIHITKNVGSDSFEKINAIAHIEMLRGWFQDVLEYLGEEGINNTVQLHTFNDIQEETDLSEGIKVQVKTIKDGNETMKDGNEIESINHVRRDLDYFANQVSQMATITDTAYETFIFQHLRETKFWLDKELFRIKEVAKQNIFSKTSQGKKKLPRRPQGQKPIFSNLNKGDANRGNAGRPIMEIKQKDSDKHLKEVNLGGITEEVEAQVKEKENGENKGEANS